jgi:hypothetical protein
MSVCTVQINAAQNSGETTIKEKNLTSKHALANMSSEIIKAGLSTKMSSLGLLVIVPIKKLKKE